MREQERRRPTIFSIISVVEAVMTAALIACCTLIFQTREAVVKLTVQVDLLQQQLADVPALTTRLAQAEVRIEANQRDIKELRDMRGLK